MLEPGPGFGFASHKTFGLVEASSPTSNQRAASTSRQSGLSVDPAGTGHGAAEQHAARQCRRRTEHPQSLQRAEGVLAGLHKARAVFIKGKPNESPRTRSASSVSTSSFLFNFSRMSSASEVVALFDRCADSNRAHSPCFPDLVDLRGVLRFAAPRPRASPPSNALSAWPLSRPRPRDRCVRAPAMAFLEGAETARSGNLPQFRSLPSHLFWIRRLVKRAVRGRPVAAASSNADPRPPAVPGQRGRVSVTR